MKCSWFAMLYSFLLYRRMKHLYIYTCAQLLSRVSLFVTPWTAAWQTPLAKRFSRQESWSGLLFPTPSDLPDPGLEPVPPASPAKQVDSLRLCHLGSLHITLHPIPCIWGWPKGLVILQENPNELFGQPNTHIHGYIYIYTHTHHIFIIHSSISGHLCYFHVLAVVDSAAMRIRVHVFFSNYGFLLINDQEWDCWVIWQLYLYFLRNHLQRGSVAKKPCANAGDVRDVGSSPGLRRACGEGNGNPLQFSCLKNPMDRGAWSVSVHEVTKSWTWLKDSMHTLTCYFL